MFKDNKTGPVNSKKYLTVKEITSDGGITKLEVLEQNLTILKTKLIESDIDEETKKSIITDSKDNINISQNQKTQDNQNEITAESDDKQDEQPDNEDYDTTNQDNLLNEDLENDNQDTSLK